MLKQQHFQLYKINLSPKGEFIYDTPNSDISRVVRYRTSVLKLLLGKDAYEFGSEFLYIREIFTIG